MRIGLFKVFGLGQVKMCCEISYVTNAISHAINAINAISHAINAISHATNAIKTY